MLIEGLASQWRKIKGDRRVLVGVLAEQVMTLQMVARKLNQFGGWRARVSAGKQLLIDAVAQLLDANLVEARLAGESEAFAIIIASVVAGDGACRLPPARRQQGEVST